MKRTPKRIETEHEIEVNKFIKHAEAVANDAVKRKDYTVPSEYRRDWGRVFIKEMDRLTAAAGLRVTNDPAGKRAYHKAKKKQALEGVTKIKDLLSKVVEKNDRHGVADEVDSAISALGAYKTLLVA